MQTGFFLSEYQYFNPHLQGLSYNFILGVVCVLFKKCSRSVEAIFSSFNLQEFYSVSIVAAADIVLY